MSRCRLRRVESDGSCIVCVVTQDGVQYCIVSISCIHSSIVSFYYILHRPWRVACGVWRGVGVGVGVLYVMVAKIRKVGCAMVCVGMDGCWFSLSRMDEACVLRTSGVGGTTEDTPFFFFCGLE